MPIPEIIVRGQRPRTPAEINPWFNITPDPRGPFPDAPGGGRGAPPPAPAPPVPAFLPPVTAPPQVLDEVIVTAKRRATLRLAATRALALGSWAFAAGSAIIGLDAYRRRLEFEADERSKKEAEDRRLQRLALEQPLPEVIVTSRAPAAFAPGPYVLPRLPEFFPREAPEPDPFIMQPIVPPQMPTQTPPVITPELPIRRPSIPVRTPTRVPTRVPTRIPFRSPWQNPQISPTRAPSRRAAPGIAPAVSPATSTPPSVQTFASTSTSQLAGLGRQALTSLNRRLSESTRAQTSPLAQLVSGNTNCKPCKPCKKEKDKPRNECWRKLVKESRYPRDDEEYKWVQIDCFTGRELRGPALWR